MDKAARTVAQALALLAALAGTLMGFRQGPDPTTVRPHILVHDSIPAHVALVDWAVERFEAAGLDLPPMGVYFHSDIMECRGHRGLYWHDEHRLDMCTDQDFGKMTILHELAHAWAESLTEDVRRTFLGIRGLETWASWDAPWEERGTEQAAEIMTWGLMDETLLLPRLADNEPEKLWAGYEVLTGAAPLFRSLEDLEDRVTDFFSPEA